MPQPPSLVDLLHHPVRWRILQTLINRALTTAELAELLPDVPATTLYRHVSTLAKADVLRVAEARQVRGTVERRYELNTGAADADNDTVDPDRLRTMFTVFVAGLAGDLDRYLERPRLDPARDGVAFRQNAIWLSDDELVEFAAEFQELLDRFAANESTSDRTRRILSTIMIPDQ
ncbi:helix-turn-helix domain-containing protein [Tamaricihabitans halophyticus]|uniref:helix-turn-helix domain-containing protein n=1 Tax=Tamaricihabitans halophyticus TaxID=1262583 RepID=UPI001FB4ADDA|nr:helix-turn-helix domain-containing protein [Tamaricihabitans halophyticus]